LAHQRLLLQQVVAVVVDLMQLETVLTAVLAAAVGWVAEQLRLVLETHQQRLHHKEIMVAPDLMVDQTKQILVAAVVAHLL
jgi:hypothetical protein